MATFTYTRADLKAGINAGIQGKIGMLTSSENTVNRSTRRTLSEIDMVSMRRRSVLAPNLFNGINDYFCPSDLKGYAIIDLPGQAIRSDREIELVPSVEFSQRKERHTIAIDDYDGVRVLKINSGVDSQSIVISELDSLASAATANWSAFGDATSIAADNDDFIKGAGSLKANITAAGGTTFGIQNATVNPVDITNYLGGTSAFFIWVKINSITGLTNYKLRFGSATGAYYEQTVTTQADGTAFVPGWNLLMFPLSSYTTTGSPVITAMKYFAIFMTKLGSKILETDYKFDYLVLKRGVISYLKYYSKFAWQTALGVRVENSSDDTDFIVCDTEEFDILVLKGITIAAREVGLTETEIQQKDKDYLDAKKQYEMNHPSEALNLTSTYYEY